MRRIDRAGKLGKAERTAGGGFRIPMSVARPGVQEYFRNGKIVREYRPPEEVFAAESLASLRDAPITIGHEVDAVTPANWAKVAAGHVSGEPVQGDGWITTDAVVARIDALAGVDVDELQEVSAGYDCLEIEAKPGVTPEGEKYDVIQRGIRYNHVALLRAGEARAGAGARLRLDSNNDFTRNEMADTIKTVRLVRIDGKDYESGSDEHVSLLQRRIDSLESTAGEAKNAIEAFEATIAAKDAEIKALKEQAEGETARTDSKVADAVKAELEFRAKFAKRLDSDYDFNGKTREQVRLDAIKKAEPDFDAEGKSEAYLEAYLDAISKRTDAFDHNSLKGKQEKRTDSKGPQTIAEKAAAFAANERAKRA